MQRSAGGEPIRSSQFIASVAGPTFFGRLLLLPMCLFLLGSGACSDTADPAEVEPASVEEASSSADTGGGGAGAAPNPLTAAGGAPVAAPFASETRAGTNSSDAAATDSFGITEESLSLDATASFDDGDSVPASLDNCAFVRNRDQIDTDGNGYGDRCDCGDASGDGQVDIADAQLLQRCALGAFGTNAAGTNNCPFALCDATGDGRCDTADARVLQRVVLGQIDTRDLVCAQRFAPTVAALFADTDLDGLTDA